MFNPKNVDDLLEYYRQVADRELTYDKQPQLAQNEPFKRSSTFPITRVHAVTTSTGNKRCFKCGGFGHTQNVCPTVNNLCYNCGNAGHRRAECTVKVIKIVGQTLQMSDDEDDTEGQDKKSVSPASTGPSSPTNDIGLVTSQSVFLSPTEEPHDATVACSQVRFLGSTSKSDEVFRSAVG